MTRLLVSVRDADEARCVVDAGVDLIDIKEPLRGSLGRAEADIVRAIVNVIQAECRLPRIPDVSMALGELPEFSGSVSLSQLIPRGIAFAKLGLAGCASIREWPSRWREIYDQFPAGVARVAVAYVDRESSDAPEPREIIQWAARLDCVAVLFDTFDKTQGDLWNHISPNDLARHLSAAEELDMLTVVGGSLNAGSLPQALQLTPGIIAIRGAACDGARDGAIKQSRLLRFVQTFREACAISRE